MATVLKEMPELTYTNDMVVLFRKALFLACYGNKLFASHNLQEASSVFAMEQEKMMGEGTFRTK